MILRKSDCNFPLCLLLEVELRLCVCLLLGLFKDYLLAFFAGCIFPPCFGLFHLIYFVELDFCKDYVYLVLPWNFLFSLTIVIECFVGYSSLG